MRLNYSFIPQIQPQVWSFGMEFHRTFYNGWHHLPMLWLELKYVDKKTPKLIVQILWPHLVLVSLWCWFHEVNFSHHEKSGDVACAQLWRDLIVFSTQEQHKMFTTISGLWAYKLFVKRIPGTALAQSSTRHKNQFMQIRISVYIRILS